MFRRRQVLTLFTLYILSRHSLWLPKGVLRLQDVHEERNMT